MIIRIFNLRGYDKKLSETTSSLKFLFKVCNPLTLTFLFNTIGIISLIFIDKTFYFRFAEENNIISTNGTILWFCYYFLFCLGCIQIKSNTVYYMPINFEENNFKENKLMLKIAFFSFYLSLIGYLIWFKDVFLNLGFYISNGIKNGLYGSRHSLERNMISGVTTMTQFGVASVIFFMILYCRTNQKKYFRYILFLIILATLRAFLFTERLALLELIVPMIFIYIRFYPKVVRKFILYGVFLFSLIWASEIFRSYTADRFSENYTPFEFLVYRLLFYSATSVNNFMLVVKQNYPYDFLPTFLEPFYKLFKIPQSPEGNWPNLLNKYLSFEFNNPSGWGEIHFNFGYGGLIFSYLLGSYSKNIFNKFRMGETKGLVIYPFLMIFILQSPRIFYLISSRTLYILLAFTFFFIVNKKRS